MAKITITIELSDTDSSQHVKALKRNLEQVFALKEETFVTGEPVKVSVTEPKKETVKKVEEKPTPVAKDEEADGEAEGETEEPRLTFPELRKLAVEKNKAGKDVKGLWKKLGFDKITDVENKPEQWNKIEDELNKL